MDPLSTFEVLHRCVFHTSSIGHTNCMGQEETIYSTLMSHNIVCSQDASANNPPDWLFLTCNQHIIVILNVLILFVPCMYIFAYLHTFHEIKVSLGEICTNITDNGKLQICRFYVDKDNRYGGTSMFSCPDSPSLFCYSVTTVVDICNTSWSFHFTSPPLKGSALQWRVSQHVTSTAFDNGYSDFLAHYNS